MTYTSPEEPSPTAGFSRMLFAADAVAINLYIIKMHRRRGDFGRWYML